MKCFYFFVLWHKISLLIFHIEGEARLVPQKSRAAYMRGHGGDLGKVFASTMPWVQDGWLWDGSWARGSRRATGIGSGRIQRLHAAASTSPKIAGGCGWFGFWDSQNTWCSGVRSFLVSAKKRQLASKVRCRAAKGRKENNNAWKGPHAFRSGSEDAGFGMGALCNQDARVESIFKLWAASSFKAYQSPRLGDGSDPRLQHPEEPKSPIALKTT